MKKILEFDEFSDGSIPGLSAEEQAQIRSFMEKYIKYFNFSDENTFQDSLEALTDDVMKRFNFDPTKRDDVQSYLSELQDLSDGLSVIMTPDEELIYRKQADYVQKFLY
jgi:hypothetical protein